MRQKTCGDCGHPIGLHSHLVPHPCKVDFCDCSGYDRD